jgi:hypothetical protein
MIVRTTPIVGKSLADRVDEAEKELQRLERLHNSPTEITVAGPIYGVRVPSLFATGGSLYWQFNYASIVQGSILEFDAACVVGDGATSLGHWCDWELRYYQQLPNIYSDAEKANRTTSAHVVLASGRVNGTGGAGSVYQSVTATIDTTAYRGTYGRIEVWLGGSSDTFGERSTFYVNEIVYKT